MSNALPQEQLKSLSDLLLSTRESAKELLSHPDNQVVLASVQSGFNKLLNRVNFLAGITHSTHIAEAQFQPIIIDGDAAVLTPAQPAAEADREAFVTRVKQLYAQFETLSPQGLLNDFRSSEDLLVLRGVAKLAGIEEYEEVEITEEFIESIQAAIKVKAEEEARQKEIDAQLEAETNAAASQLQEPAPTEDLDDVDDLDDDGVDIPIPGVDTPSEPTPEAEQPVAETDAPAQPAAEAEDPTQEEQATVKHGTNSKAKKGK